MRILEVSRYKNNFTNHQLPFVIEQGEALRAAGCEVEYFLVKGSYLLAVRELKRIIRKFKPDIVHAHFGLSAITAELQSLVPVVTTFHNGETLNPFVNFASSLMSLRAKHVIYVAQHIRDLSYFKAKNYSIIPCGVPMEQMVVMPKDEARKQLGWDADKKYILFGGAFDNLRKNYPLLRDAIGLLYSTKTQINVAFDKWVINDQTTPLIGRDDHCLRSPQELEIIGDPIGEVTQNAHSTSVSSNSPHGLECNQPQVLTSELAAPVVFYPQVLKNVRVKSKPDAQNDPDVQQAVAKVAEELGDSGRILVRESGTEPVIRVMVEAGTDEECEKYVDDVIYVIQKKGHIE